MPLPALAGAVAAGVASRPKVKRTAATKAGPQAAVFSCLVTVVGAGCLKSWVVDEKATPGREWWIKIAIMGYVLSQLSEFAPKLGKNTAYLIMVATTFAQAEPILKKLQEGPGQKKLKVSDQQMNDYNNRQDGGTDHGAGDFRNAGSPSTKLNLVPARATNQKTLKLVRVSRSPFKDPQGARASVYYTGG